MRLILLGAFLSELVFAASISVKNAVWGGKDVTGYAKSFCDGADYQDPKS